MPKFNAVFTRSDTLDPLPNDEIIETPSEEITIGELMKSVELRRRELSKKFGFEVLFAVLTTEDGGQILSYNAHNL